MKTIKGNVWRFGHHIDTDIIIPARHLVLPMDEMKAHAMAPVAPGFAANVRPGDILVAGDNFGCGSSREQAPAVLMALGIQAVVARSVARIFFRNAVNLGLLVVECPDVYDPVEDGQAMSIDPKNGEIRLPDSGLKFSFPKLPGFLMEIVSDGGLLAHIARNG